MIERYGELAERLGLGKVPRRPGRLSVPEGVRSRVLEKFGLGEDYIALCPGARWSTKRWGEERFAELIRRLHRKGMKTLLVGDRADRPVSRRVNVAAGGDALDLTGRTTIAEVAAVLAQCRALVGNDSGLIHLAEAVGVPVVALFGPTVEEFGYFPSLPGSKVCERKLRCRPCSRNGSRPCPLGTKECLEGIGVDLVEGALEDLLQKRGPARYQAP